jgi:TolA-binding protein
MWKLLLAVVLMVACASPASAQQRGSDPEENCKAPSSGKPSTTKCEAEAGHRGQPARPENAEQEKRREQKARDERRQLERREQERREDDRRQEARRERRREDQRHRGR